MRHEIPVLQFVDSFIVGGTERQFLNLVKALRGTEFRPHVACFRAEGEMLDEVRGMGLPFREWRIPSLRSPRAAARLIELVRYLRRHRIQVVHTTNLYPNVFGVAAAWLARTPVIVASVRDMGQVWSADLRRLQRAACRLADGVVTNAGAIARRLRAEGWNGGKIEVIHNGFVPPEPCAAEGPGIRAELGIPPGVPIVGAICRLHPVKRLGDLLDAAALLTGRHPEARFVIVGPLTGSPVFEACARELRRRTEQLGLGGRVILTGARTDVPRILSELSVSVLPSASEGLSNALLESMAAGVPVVATAVGGNPEVVEDGVTGILVPPADPASLAGAIGYLLESPALAAAFGRAGRERVDEHFGLDLMVENTTRLYRRLLERPHRGRVGVPALSRAGSAP